MVECQVLLQNGILTLENARIRRLYRWNGGALIGLRIEDVARGHGWSLEGRRPDLLSGDGDLTPSRGRLEVVEVAATSVMPAHLRAEVVTSLGALEIKRVFRLYPDCPAIGCDLYLTATEASGAAAVALNLERLALPGRHWRATVVQFYDVTDRHNNLVHARSVLPFRYELPLKGNLLFLDELLQDGGLFILKEAPSSYAQLHYPGADFIVGDGEVRVVGLGLSAADLTRGTWTRAYSVVTGVTGDGELGRLQALRSYQDQLRLRLPDRDEMLMMNTWGDRGQDTRISEAFALAELEAGARLGISHFQLDDGWQSGRSSNSAYDGGSLEGIWDASEAPEAGAPSRSAYWQPHPERFPHGLRPVVQRGRELGIEVCLWFNPSKDDSYAHWHDDAETLIGLYRDDGIRTFKIDGVQLPDKEAEINLRRMFDTVRTATGDDVVFNLDVTAGQRYGYHFFNEYGTLFVENRYTDWSNYYPHWTLRNLWMLSRYVPAQSLQTEFLNIWRNADLYGMGDPLAPQHVPFSYAFAITMMAQPLAWFEATGLPAEAFEIADLVRTYREHQTRIHAGHIFPIGEEPSGTGWAGFQSIRDDGGYVLVFRELNERPAAGISLWGDVRPGTLLRHVVGSGNDVTVGEGGEARFTLPHPLTFALYEVSTKSK